MKTPATKAAPKKHGGQDTYTDAKADQVIEQVSSGVPLAQVCRDIGVGLRTWYDWCDARPALAARIARARRYGHDVIAERTRETARGRGDTSGDVVRDKLIIETDLKLLAKWDPRYSDKLAIGGAADLPPIMSNTTVEPSEAYKLLLGGR